MPMLDRIVMNVIEVTLEVVFVFQCVFPIPCLPHPASPCAPTSIADVSLSPALKQPLLREFLFDPAPAIRILIVAGRQRPDGVQVFWKQHQSIDREWPLHEASAEHASKQSSTLRL